MTPTAEIAAVRGQALIINYRGIAQRAAPPFIDRRVLREQLDCLSDCGARTLTITELADALRAGALPPRAIALTFEGGLRYVAAEAAPLLAERELTATFFCSPGLLGRQGTERPGQPDRQPSLTASDIAELAHWGFEVGSQGMGHARLDTLPSQALADEVRESRLALEQITAAPVLSFALPYGVLPGRQGRRLIEETYFAACGEAIGTVGVGTDPYYLPRVGAHFLRRPGVLRRALVGSFPPYLRAMRAGARARRMLRPDERVPA